MSSLGLSVIKTSINLVKHLHHYYHRPFPPKARHFSDINTDEHFVKHLLLFRFELILKSLKPVSVRQNLQILFLTLASVFLFKFSNAQKCKDSLGSIKFSEYSSRLSKETKKTLDIISKQMLDKPTCNISIIGCCSAIEDHKMNRATWDRVKKIHKYLFKKWNFHSNRFVFKYGSDPQDRNTILFLFTADTVDADPPYHPSRTF